MSYRFKFLFISLFGALALLGAACETSHCDFTARCEGNELVTCSVQESIGPSFEPPFINRTKCEGLNPVCMADNTFSSNCVASTAPQPRCNENPSSTCRGNIHVSCVGIRGSDGGAVQYYERLHDCSEPNASRQEAYVCSEKVPGNICVPAPHHSETQP